ncbi:MAG: methyltransferase domain-containing protein [Candidatus Niyogibacteria bacterium]|nr:methyltransferase domain-containing protein [Candidatus Niyogibacteria bacterium]
MAFLNPEGVIKAIGIDVGMTIADFGSGAGFYTIPMARAVGPTGKVYALDVQKSALEVVKSKAKEARLLNIHPMWADLDTLGGSHLADGSAHVALISNILFQSDHKKELLQEAFRILGAKGRIAVIDWAFSARGGPAADRVVKQEAAEKLLEEAGFSKVREFFAGDAHYGLLYQKP